jgi:nucleotide-binding universal stress UspA family protein
MINDVLVCLEGSDSSVAATQVAIALARELPARLAGLAIVDEPDIRAGTAVGIGGAAYKHERDETLVADAHRQATDWIALFESRCRDGDVTVRAIEVVGRPAASILERMGAYDLTVIGRDANFRFETERDDPGTIDQVLRRGARPVLVVPEGTAAPLGGKVLFAYDGSSASRSALVSFASSGLAASRELHVATVDEDGAAAWVMAERGVGALREAGLSATAHKIVSALANADALFELGAHLGVSVIVMGAFDHSRLPHLFAHSAMRGLIEKSHVPVYVYR